MIDFSPNLGFQFLLPGQAQKHITVNETLAVLDSVVHLSVVSATELEPLPGNEDGDRQIVPDGAIGAFAGQDGQLALRDSGSWQFLAPREGWRAWIEDTQSLHVFSAGAWRPAMTENINQLGINAAPDETNRLAVSSEAALFTHDGHDHRLKINRATSGDAACILFQTDFIGGAELGLSGVNGLSVRTSPDGTNWKTRLECPEEIAGVRVSAMHGGTISLDEDTSTNVPTPEVSGIFFLWSHSLSFPNLNHSAVFLFDVGPSLSLVPIYLGSGVSNCDTIALTGTTGDANRTSISVQTDEIQVESRRSGVATYRYAFLA
ncbi:DUF2793 domain-containing protein [Hyphomonas atlantica]|uniref:DUF2793 domain-containing protein n=1 Tax=Hyphomonas atlantica TaxID=1280948 RepID=A0A059DWR2_9PROT|nr:DUF2793 domain-containing protein [Hyphomonas atlantica]KCZ57808.1 hypothetical protein HY36_11565 [Hyphomonas atlantica]